MPEKDAENQVFDAAYVKTLRDENASWRTKVRQLEAGMEISSELGKRGIKADYKWVNMGEGKSVIEAVDEFEKAYPHLVGTTQTTTTQPAKTPQPGVGAKSLGNTNTPTDLGTRSAMEVKKDPVARAKLRDQYRSMLQSSSYQKDPEYK